MPQESQQEFTNVRPLAPRSSEFENVRPISSDPHAEIKKKYGLPPETDLSQNFLSGANAKLKMDPFQFSRAYQEANPPEEKKGFFRGIWEEGKTLAGGMFDVSQAGPWGATPPGTAIKEYVEGVKQGGPIAAVPVVGPMVAARYEQAKTDLPGAIGAGLVDVAALELGRRGVKSITAAPKTAALQKSGGIRQLLGRRLSAEEANRLPATARFNPALANTPAEILEHAASEGIDLTPAQATKAPLQRTIQAVGERSLFGANQLAEGIDANAGALIKSVRKFADKVDPKALGLSEEAAGEAIQQNAKVALDVAKENASQAYKQVSVDQANLAGDISSLSKFAKEVQFVREPNAAVARKVYQTPGAQAALTDIGSAPERLGPNPSIRSLRNLRTEFWEKGNDFSGAVPDSARALYKQAAEKVDNAMMRAAKGTPFEESFREASAQWKALQEKYNEKGTPLARILQEKDPAKIVRSILNRASAADIEIMQKEGMTGAIEALKRQVIEEVVRNKFRNTAAGLAGYSDSFLNTLFGREALKELYLKSEIGRRFAWEMNPSGTSNVMIGEHQISHPEPSKLGLLYGAAKMSMPRDPNAFLPGMPTSLQTLLSPIKRKGIRTTPFLLGAASPSNREP